MFPFFQSSVTFLFVNIFDADSTEFNEKFCNFKRNLKIITEFIAIQRIQKRTPTYSTFENTSQQMCRIAKTTTNTHINNLRIFHGK